MSGSPVDSRPEALPEAWPDGRPGARSSRSHERWPERWQLPDGVDELLPAAAWRVERLRRRFLDLGASWGFELVAPPIIEYLDSLLTGTGEVMNLQTFKLVDQQDGRTLGVRADMTPQVARMDAHAMAGTVGGGINRLFYTGTVLRARTDGFGGSRNPQQLGAELFGHAGVDSDLEIVRLMIETVLLTGIEPGRLVLDLGHVGVYAGLSAAAGLEPAAEAELFSALLHGSRPDVRAVLTASSDALEKALGAREATDAAGRLDSLADLAGGVETVARARDRLGGSSARVVDALDTLERMIAGVRATHPGVRVHVDLGELRGYRYHTGMLFAVHDEDGSQLARGGRYDAVGAAFGSARAATGFSADLKALADLAADLGAADPAENARRTLIARDDAASAAWQMISALRAQGDRVIVSLDGADEAGLVAADGELVQGPDGWHVRPISPTPR